MQTPEQMEVLLRERADVGAGHPAAPFLRDIATAVVNYALEHVLAEREACATVAETSPPEFVAREIRARNAKQQ